MIFDIDISGKDILNHDFSIAVSDNKNITLGFRFDNIIQAAISYNFSKNRYKYYGKNKLCFLKIRVYSIILFNIFKKIIQLYPKIKDSKIILNICRDFDGHQNDIEANLKYFLEENLFLKIIKFNHSRLADDSNAHKYAFLFRKDYLSYNHCLIQIRLEDFEKDLIKK